MTYGLYSRNVPCLIFFPANSNDCAATRAETTAGGYNRSVSLTTLPRYSSSSLARSHTPLCRNRLNTAHAIAPLVVSYPAAISVTI